MSASNVNVPLANSIIADTLSEEDMAGPATHDALVEPIVHMGDEIYAVECGALSTNQCMLSVRAGANKVKGLLKTYREPYRRNLRGAISHIDHIKNLTNPTQHDLRQLDDWCKQAKIEFETLPRDVGQYEVLCDWYQDNVWHNFVVKHKGRILWQLHDCLSELEVSLMGLLDLVKDAAQASRQLKIIRQQLRLHLQVHSKPARSLPAHSHQAMTSETSHGGPVRSAEQPNPAATSNTTNTGKVEGRQVDTEESSLPVNSQSRRMSSFRISPSTVNTTSWLKKVEYHDQDFQWAEDDGHAIGSDTATIAQHATVTQPPAGPPPSIPNSLATLQVVAAQAPTRSQAPAFGNSFSAIEEILMRTGPHRRAATQAPGNYTATTTTAGPPQLGSVIRRSGRGVPRIFTGSFDELERSLHKISAAPCESEIQSPSPAAPFPDEPKIRVNVRDFADPLNPPRPLNLQMHNGRILARRPNARAPVQRQLPTQIQTLDAVQQTVQLPIVSQQSATVTADRPTALRSAPVSQAATRASSPHVSSRQRENTI